MRSRAATIGILAAALAALSCLAVWPAFNDPVEWTPDALYYQARVLELRGEDNAFDKVFEGPLAAELRARDPGHTGNETWVEYNEPFYERRVAVPLAAAALYPVAEERSLLDLSLVGYIAAVLALFGLLLLRYRIALAAAVAGAALRCCLRSRITPRSRSRTAGVSRWRSSRSAPQSSPSSVGSLGCRSGSERSACSRSLATAPGSRSSRWAGLLCAAGRACR